MFDNPVTLAILVIVLLVILFLIANTIHIVRQYERLVVFTFGRVTNGAAGPGILLLVPIVQQTVKVDLREFYIEIPQQTCITKDNAPISIDFLVYSKVFDPEESVTAVTSFSGATFSPIANRSRETKRFPTTGKEPVCSKRIAGPRSLSVSTAPISNFGSICRVTR